MKPVRRVLPALLLSVFAGAVLPAANAAQFSNVVVFGDSLSDVGYFRPFLASQGLPASLVATLGRFTTNPGPVWSEIIAQYYGFTANPSNASGSVYAQGGARVALDSASTPPGGAQRPVSVQITEYLARTGGVADPNALHTVWAGANDFFAQFTAFAGGQITQAQLQTNVLAAATAEIGQIARLYSAGARYVVVFTLPDIGATPQFAGLGATAAGAATQLSAGYNTTLLTGLATAGLRVIPVDAFSLLAEIRANPAAYGFTNITGIACGAFPPVTTAATASAQFCYTGNLVAPGADRSYLFADGVHPTTAAHAIIGDFVKQLIEGPTQYSLVAESALRMRSAHLQTLNDGLMNGQSATGGKITAFAAAAGGGFDVDSQGTSPGFESSNKAYTVGLTMRASDAVTVGAALGKTKADGTFGREAGGFRSSEDALSFFFGFKTGGYYANGAATISNLDMTQSHRAVKLGQVTRVADAQTGGSNASGFVNAGYDFALGRFSVGPTLAYTTQNVEVNAFDETGAGSANLRISAQKRRSEVASFGVRASMNLGAWTPYVKFTADKERKNSERMVSASPLSLASGNTYEVPAYRPADSSFGTLNAGVRGWITDYLAVSVNYTKITGRSGVKEDGVAGTLSLRF